MELSFAASDQMFRVFVFVLKFYLFNVIFVTIAFQIEDPRSQSTLVVTKNVAYVCKTKYILGAKHDKQDNPTQPWS